MNDESNHLDHGDNFRHSGFPIHPKNLENGLFIDRKDMIQ